MIKITPDKQGRFPDVYVVSDCHYSHQNICRGVTNWRMPDGKIPIAQTRDFETIDKMNAAIVNNINEVVGQDDILICLGDWSFGGYEKIREFWDRLICKNIHLVLGNHDDHIKNNKGGCQGLFKSVSEYNRLEIGQYRFELCHYPMSSWRDLNKGSMMLHGHVHLPPHKKFGLGKRIDCGMDGHTEFRPYHILNEIVPMLKNRPIMSEIGGDHHTDNLKGIVG
jgi:calcineurin-like phosphoesterase family protein